MNVHAMENNGLSYVVGLMRAGRFVPDSILIPADAGEWTTAQIELRRWLLAEFRDEVAEDAVENMKQFGEWPSFWDSSYLKGFLGTVRADDDRWIEIDAADRDWFISTVEKKVRRIMAEDGE